MLGTAKLIRHVRLSSKGSPKWLATANRGFDYCESFVGKDRANNSICIEDPSSQGDDDFQPVITARCFDYTIDPTHYFFNV
jgi:hypothetical protein